MIERKLDQAVPPGGCGASITTIADSSGSFEPCAISDICINDQGDVTFCALAGRGER